jgi:hypothetical protein
MDAGLSNEVRRRAGNRCEYCRMPQDAHVRSFAVDHVIARQHGGKTDADNLALACLRCNSHKGPNVAGLDPASGAITRLFHPRQDQWEDHFQWQGPLLAGLTDVGRTTIEVLTMNHPDYVALRESLIEEGVFKAL